MRDKVIVVVSGYAQSGKDTFANEVESRVGMNGGHARYIRYKFADMLRDAVSAAFAVLKIERSAWTEDKEEKKRMRPLFVELGEYARDYDEGVFANCVADQIEDDLIAFTDLAIITDLRYHNEHQIIKALAAKHRWKFIWVHIVRTENLPANETERKSVNNLLDKEVPDLLVKADNGDTKTIANMANDFVRTSLPPHWATTSKSR